MSHSFCQSLRSFSLPSGSEGKYYSLAALEEAGLGTISRLPVSIRIVLESVLRNLDGEKVTEDHIKQLAAWKPNDPRTHEIPFMVARVVLQDFTGVPLLADLAAMRGVAQRLGKDPKRIEPLVPVDLVVDHSVQIDHYGNEQALDLNMKLEFQRNHERYQFLKWGMQAFETFKVVPPGIGIVHQVNLEYLARGVHQKNNIYYPDSLVGTDSHTTMINGVGVVGWGVGGIEAEAGMLGQPVYFLTPDVVGVHLTGKLREGVTATDLVLTITELLRMAKVVGKFVEFFGEGAAALSVSTRATVANMAPEYGATMGFFPVDNATIRFMESTGRTLAETQALEAYFKAQGLFGVPQKDDIDYSQVLELNLDTVVPSVAGPKRPQDRIALDSLSQKFTELFSAVPEKNGFNQPSEKLAQRFKTSDQTDIGSGDVLIAAITSCTNTSNPSVLLAAGLLAKRAVELGLSVRPHIKTSLAPGSRVVTDYLTRTGLLPYLQKLGFNIVAYGCTTCIGNSGPLSPSIEEAITEHDLIACAVLSGNRNFEARIHSAIKANFLASPPLVVAYAIAGNVTKDIYKEPLGIGTHGEPIFLRDIWPTDAEVNSLLEQAFNQEIFRERYRNLDDHPLWQAISSTTGQVYNWADSTYIAEPPFFAEFPSITKEVLHIKEARALALLGDSVTTDHISPAGAIKASSPAGKWLQAHGVSAIDFNSYGARRGHHEVMMRGTFANVRIKNLMIPPKEDGTMIEGGITRHLPDNAVLSIYDAAMLYKAEGIPTIIFAGEEYGTGSSRDWAAKGTSLQGVKAVIAKSFERIHRANLVGMGVLPLQFIEGHSIQSLKLTGDEVFNLNLGETITPQGCAVLSVCYPDNTVIEIPLLLRIDTPIEVRYYAKGGILPFVLESLLN
ncbi:MAG: aconitate hydratase AcnA [Pseudomonadota bacterium]